MTLRYLQRININFLTNLVFFSLFAQLEFNNRFYEFVKLKKDEIVKIEEKNERINQIIGELQVIWIKPYHFIFLIYL
jgi:hypothetical protein